MKEELEIIEEVTVDLNFYAVRSKDGKWLRRKGYCGGGESWVEDITQARIYGKPGPARAQITYWANHYPNYGIPDLVRISTGVCQVLDENKRVEKARIRKEIEEKKRKIWGLKDKIKRTQTQLDNTKPLEEKIESLKKELEELS